jgi:hypothetical protein
VEGSLSLPELNLDDPYLAREGTQGSLSIVNTADSPVRFKWAVHPAITFTPALGHLAPGARRDVIVRFKASAPEKLVDLPLLLTSQKLRYADPASACGDWDNTRTTLRPGTAEEVENIRNPVVKAPEPVGKPAKGKGKAAPEPEKPPEAPAPVMTLGPLLDNGVQMVIVVDVEPAHELFDAPQEQPLLISAVADKPRYEADASALAFKNTAMFQARVATFSVKNASNTRLPFSLSIAETRPPHVPRPTGEPIPCPFTVTPADGSVAPQSSQTFSVRFLPTEVDDFYYTLAANMPTLPRDMEQLRVSLRGQSFRPACHFELLESNDYLARRASNLRNEHGQLGAIESPSIRYVDHCVCRHRESAREVEPVLILVCIVDAGWWS